MRFRETAEAYAVLAVIISSLFLLGCVVATFADLVATGPGLVAVVVFAVLLGFHVVVLIAVRRLL